MGLRDILNAAAGQLQLLSPFGAWARRVSTTVDSLVAASTGSNPPLHVVRVATTTSLGAATMVGGVKTITALGSINPVDGVTLVPGDRILDKDDPIASQRGIFVVTSTGSGITQAVLTRATDMAQGTPGVPETLVGVSVEGTVNGDTFWALDVPAPITIGVTALDFKPIEAGTALPLNISDAAPSAGVSNRFSKQDHVHAHGARGGGALHALVTPGAAGFMSGADKTKLDGIFSLQRGSIALVAGDSGAIPVNLKNSSSILVTLKSVSGSVLTTKYVALSRINGLPGSFHIFALTAAEILNVADVSSLDWLVVD